MGRRAVLAGMLLKAVGRTRPVLDQAEAAGGRPELSKIEGVPGVSRLTCRRYRAGPGGLPVQMVINSNLRLPGRL